MYKRHIKQGSNSDACPLPPPFLHHMNLTLSTNLDKLHYDFLIVWSHLNVDMYVSKCDFPGGSCAWIIIKQGL